MDITVHQLRLLVQVRDHGTISAAASALRITPSAASQQLSVLEGAVDTPVLTRVGRGVQLTDAGRAMVRHAELILGQLEAARAEMEQIRGQVTGTLRVGVLESLTSKVLPELLLRMRDCYPDLSLQTYQVETAPVQRVLSGELDAAFEVEYPGQPARRDDGLVRHHVCRDWFKVVVGTNDPLEGPTAPLSALQGRPMVSSSKVHSCGQCIAAACRAAGFEPQVVHEIDDYPGVLNLVAAGAGVALVPDLGLLSPPSGVRIIVPEPQVCRHVQLICRQTSADRPSIVAFRRILDEVAKAVGLDRRAKAKDAVGVD